MKILDITAIKNMSSAIAENKLIYIWGFCLDQKIRKPVACEYTNVFDMSNALSARPPTTVKYLNTDQRSCVLKDFADAFDDPVSLRVCSLRNRFLIVRITILFLKS